MIKGIQAFEACWMKLKSSYPTDQSQNLMIAQAMGQVTDRYGTVEEVVQTLPTDLRVLFRKLIHAYFHGFTVEGYTEENTMPVNSSTGGNTDQIQTTEPTPKCQPDAEMDPMVASDGPSPADDRFQSRRRQFKDVWPMNLHEAETLILEIPVAG